MLDYAPSAHALVQEFALTGLLVFTGSEVGGGDTGTSSSLRSRFSEPDAETEPVSMSSLIIAQPNLKTKQN